MKKRTLKLINDEYLNKKVISAKACDETSTDICYDENADYAHCEVYSYDVCTKDYAACVKYSYDYCAVKDMDGCETEDHQVDL